MKTRFFYGDGTFSDTKPTKKNNVQAIVQQTEFDGKFITSGNDWYINHKGEWIGVDLFGALDWLMEKGYLLAGRTITDKDFSDVMRKAIEYRDG